MGAAPGMFGTVRAQLALHQVFVFTESFVMPKPELMVPLAAGKFDGDGNLTDDDVRERLRGVLDELVAWARRVSLDRPTG